MFKLSNNQMFLFTHWISSLGLSFLNLYEKKNIYIKLNKWMKKSMEDDKQELEDEVVTA